MALPTIITQPRSTVVEIYDVATFECTARSYGTVSITWRRLYSGLPVTANVTTIKSLNGITSILRIRNSIGYYYCIAENKAGILTSTLAYCNIKGKSMLVCLFVVPCPQMIILPLSVVCPNTVVTFSLAWSNGSLVLYMTGLQ